MVARCRSRAGGTLDVRVLDLSAFGCMIDRRTASLKPKDRVLIKLQRLAFQAATVIWVEDDRAGLEFEQPLYEPVLEYLKAFGNGPLS